MKTLSLCRSIDPNKPMQIIIFDDHHVMTNTLETYFSNIDGWDVMSSFNKRVDVLIYLQTNTVDIIITDLPTDEEIGLDLISQLRKNAPKSLIIVYSDFKLEIIKENCIENGANLCIPKTEPIAKLHQAIQEILKSKIDGQGIVSQKRTSKINLTIKERIIIDCMITGMSSQEIADNLGLSPNTINNQKNHMIKKFDCNSSTELVAKLFRQGFLKV